MPVVQRAEIDPAAREALRPYLAPGEALTWAGFPAPGRFGRGTWFLLLFAIPWTAFALFWEGGVLLTARGSERVFMGLFGLPFLADGHFMLRAAFKSMSGGRDIVYGTTTERVLLVRTGKQPAGRAYDPADLALPRLEEDKDGLLDVYFAADADMRGFMPGAAMQGGQALDRVGFLGVPPAAAAAVQAVHARRAPGALAGPVAASAKAEAPQRTTARGSVEACRVKLAGVLAVQRAERKARHQTVQRRFWQIAPLLVAAPPVIGYAAEGREALIGGLFMAAVFAGIAALVRFSLKYMATQEEAHSARYDYVQGLLAAWQADAHPRARFEARVDFAPALGVVPYRFANSPSSKALKTWHRHRWARFAWATACGSLLVVELIDKVKYKSGAEVKREAVLRGWLVPNEAVWHASALEEPFQAGRLRVVPREVEGQRVLAFRAVVAGPEDTAETIAGLYEALARRRRPVAR